MPLNSIIIIPPLIMKNTIVFTALLAVISLSFLYFQKNSNSDPFSQWKQDFGVQFSPGE